MKLNLAKRIAMYVGILIIIVCLGLGLTTYQFSSNTLISEAEDALLLLAEEGAESVDAVIQGNLNVIETIANRSEIRTMDWEQQLATLQNEFSRLEEQGYLGLGVVTPDGTARYVDGTETYLGDREYVQRALAGESNVSDVLISRVTDAAVLMYAAPIYDMSGEVGGVLITRRPGYALNVITDRMGYGEQGYAYITGADGTIYAHPVGEHIMNRRNAIIEVETGGSLQNWGLAVQELGLGNSGVISYELDGDEMHIGVATIPSTGWSVGIVAAEDELLASLADLRTIILMVSLAFLILGILVAVYIGNVIAKPMKASSQFTAKMVSGDLTQNIPEEYLNRNDEIGELTSSLATLNQGFRNTIGEIQNSAQELASSSQQMSAVSENSSANMKEVSASTEEISASLEEVSAAAEEISASSEQMNASTSELVGSMKRGNQTAKEIEAKALKVQGEVEEGQQKAFEIYTELDARLKVGIEKAKIVDQISNMADQIADIAEQTNLLALNAAIEAARAGEQGRGFAVVAEEVRKLATNSTETVTSIQDLTAQVQGNIRTLVGDANQLLQFVTTDVNEDYKKFLETAEEYKNDAHTFYTITDQAASMGEEVLHAVGEVTRSINEVTETIGQSAEGADQIASGTSDTSSSMAEINEASGRLAKMSEDLSKLINQFKV
ncbi:methyl-accepting chemotaxis protein [Desulfitispora alkaliphila]|uniref:methyl-accepting chemotaxis protein n=1 Tax=Desulfitispora alkaliphila TaxID=622674 RepID=UPI003D250825